MKQHTRETLTEWGALLAWIVLMIVILLALMLSGGCTRKVYVPVENTTVRTDTVYQSQLRVDSVFCRDSVAVIQKGDTVLITKWRDRYRVKQRTDTVYKAVTDSVKVSVPYPVERELTKWEQTKQDVGGMAMGALGVAVLAAAIAWVVKRKRNR